MKINNSKGGWNNPPKSKRPLSPKPLNPENICERLNIVANKNDNDKLEKIWKMQEILQERYGINPKYMKFKDRINLIQRHWRDVCIEFAEMMERLPFKEWKKYDEKVLKGYINKSQELETKYEYVDLMHFVINIGLCLGITAEELYLMYDAKNRENHDRQKRGY